MLVDLFRMYDYKNTVGYEKKLVSLVIECRVKIYHFCFIWLLSNTLD